MKNSIILMCTLLFTFSVAYPSQATTDQPQADQSVVECAHAILQANVNNPEHNKTQLPSQIYSSYAALFIKHTQGSSIPMSQKTILLLGFDLLYNQQNTQKHYYLRSPLINAILSYFTIHTSHDYSYYKHQNLYATTTELRKTLGELIDTHETPESGDALHKEVLLFTTTLYTHGLILKSSWTYTDYAWFGLKVATTLSTLVAMLVVIKKTVSVDLGKVISEAGHEISTKTSTSLEKSLNNLGEKILEQAPVIVDSVAERMEKVIDRHWPTTLKTLAEIDLSQVLATQKADELLHALAPNATGEEIQTLKKLLEQISEKNSS